LCECHIRNDREDQMLPRPIRAPITVLAILGMVGALTVSAVAAQTETPTCSAQDTSTGEATEGVTLTYDSAFVCPDAADAGTWSITVNVSNASDTTSGLTLNQLTLSHTSPRPGGVGPAAGAEASGLPLSLAAGESGTFDASGTYELVETDEGNKANLHLRVSGATDEDEPFLLGINVLVRAPGVDENGENGSGENGENGKGDAEGRPEWVPGPPPWVRAILEVLFANGFPWGTDDFPPAIGTQDAEDGDNGDIGTGAVNGEEVADAARPDWVPGPPPWAPDDEEDEEDDGDGPPAFVPPAGGPPDLDPAPPAGPGGRP
jgi:hypothetical protein